MFWEDMAYNHGPLLSPEFYRRYCLPFYRVMVDLVRRNGVRVIMLDSDSDISELIPLWLDAGINVLYTSTWYNHQIFLESPERSIPAPSALMGPLCMNIDVINESIMLPRLPRGKRLIIHPAGAYNTTQWMQFIQYRPAVALIRENGTVELIRSREKLADMDICEQLPKDLRAG